MRIWQDTDDTEVTHLLYLFFLGMMISSIFSATCFSTIFKRKLFFTILFFNSFSILYQIFNLTILFAAPIMIFGTEDY